MTGRDRLMVFTLLAGIALLVWTVVTRYWWTLPGSVGTILGSLGYLTRHH